MRQQATILAGLVAVVLLCLVIGQAQAHRDYDYEGGGSDRNFSLAEMGDSAVEFVCKIFGEAACDLAKRFLELLKQAAAKDRKLSEELYSSPIELDSHHSRSSQRGGRFKSHNRGDWDM